jgi:TonB family protein
MIGAAIAMMLAPAVPAGLAPTSQWLIDDKEQCTLSRDYDSSGAQLTVGLRTAPFVQAIRLLVVTQGAGTAPTSGRAMVTLFSGEPIDIRYGSYRTTADVRRVVVMAMGTEAMAGLEASRTLSVAIGDEAPITVQLAGIKAGLAMLKTCSDTLLRRWGVDQAEADRIATPAVPIGDPGTWITSEDYPSSALRAERQGSVLIVWTIGLDGVVSDCRTAVSSGDADLDAAACRAIVRRARYQPATGNDGKPVLSHFGRMVAWRIPG